MQLILLTEAIDINTKMTDVDVQQPLDDVYVANGQLESKIDTKLEDVKTFSGSGDSKLSAETITAASKNCKTDETNGKEEIEDFNQMMKNDPTGIKFFEDKNVTLPIGDKKSSGEPIVEETNDSDITLEGPVANKSENQNGAQISVFENGEENKSLEIYGVCVSSQRKNTSVINELDNYQIPEDEPMEHEDISISETEIKDKQEPEGGDIEKVILVKGNLENTEVLFKSEGENISELEYINKETTKKTAQAESKLIEQKPKEINEITSSATGNYSANSHVQCMEQDPTSEMMANEIPLLETNLNVHNFKDTMADTTTEEENVDEKNFNPLEQKCLSQEKSSLIVNHDSEPNLQEKNITKAGVSEKNGDEVLLPEDDPMEQDPLPEADNLILKNDDSKSILQKINKVSDNFVVKDNSVENTLLSEEEPMEQANNSLMEEVEIVKKQTVSPEHENGDNISETDLQCASTADEAPSPETVKTVFTNNDTVSDDCAAKDNSVENTLFPEEKPVEQENTSEKDLVDKSMKEAENMRKKTEPSEDDNADKVSETIETEHQSSSTTDKTASPETLITTSDKVDCMVMNNSFERHEETKIESLEEEQTSEEIKVDDNCTESETKLISVLNVKSPTEINESSLTTELEVQKKTNDLDTTESSEIEQSSERKNDLGMSERPVEVQYPESILADKGDEIELESNESEELNKRMETTLKSKVNEDSNEKIKTEATKTGKLINDANTKDQSSAEPTSISEQNEDTKIERSERAEEISDDRFALNYSDEECEIIKSKGKNKSPSKTEEILDTIIACMEVDRGENKRVVETDNIDTSVIKTDIPPEVTTKRLCDLSNTLDILSDDDDNVPEDNIVKTTDVNESSQNSINIDDDDDVMLIDEEPSNKDGNAGTALIKTTEENCITTASEETKEDAKEKGICTENKEINKIYETSPPLEKEPETAEETVIPSIQKSDITETLVENSEAIKKVEKKPKPLVPENFLKTFKSKVADMTREDLEDLCLQVIVEGVIDKSNFSEIKTKLKTMSSNMEEWRKKTMILTKQNRDLQIVLKTVQEEQKKRSDGNIVPLKITRSVGMQVYIADNERGIKRKNPNQTSPNNKNTRNAPNPNPRQQQKSNAQIPVPRLVPAITNSPAKNSRPSTPQVQNTTVTSNSGVKTSSPHALPSGVKNSAPVKPVEKRTFSSVQSVTVDLTDDEPPPKQQVTARNAPQPPVRLVAQNQLLSARAQNQNNGPRKVYIPINSQNQAIRPGQTIMLKSVPPGAGPRPRALRPMVTIPSNGPVRMPRFTSNHRHPAPLPDVAKQQQPPNWKALPPSPDLKISKVENGIVISWTIEAYQQDSYEEIASYQLYAYQETSTPPSTLLWKKIGDVKALPLPMACTLTQFMAGYKYYFAVRAIDIRSRIGPFSLPGSILLLNK